MNAHSSRLLVAVTAALALALLGGGTLFAQEEGCFYCGMKKAMFGHSWVQVVREDGSSVGVCSVHCAGVDMAVNIDKPAKTVTVGDYGTKAQIDADKAFWVIGGDKPGVMTKRAKWAFEAKQAADDFIKQSGGKPATFEEVMKAAFEDMYEDTRMIQERRKARRAQQGGAKGESK